MAAMAACPAQPRNADALTRIEFLHARAHGRYFADDLMAGNHAPAECRQIAVNNVQIGAAHAAGGNSNQQLARTRRRRVSAHELKWCSWFARLHYAHGEINRDSDNSVSLNPLANPVTDIHQ